MRVASGHAQSQRGCRTGAPSIFGVGSKSAYRVGQQAVGPWTFGLVRLGDVASGEPLRLKWYGSTHEGHPYVKQARLKLVGDTGHVHWQSSLEPGDPLRATQALPDESISDLGLELFVEAWDGQEITSRRAVTSLTGGKLVDGPKNAPRVPWSVWAVIISLVVCTGTFTGGWFYYVGRVTAGRTESSGEVDVSSSPSHGNGAAVKPVRIDGL